MKILVTGGAGFIGSHVVDALIKKGDEVVIIDNFSTGFEKNINPAAKLYRLSIGDTAIEKIFEWEKPQVVIHLAAQTSVTRSITDPTFDAGVNILGSLNVISNCVRSGVHRIVYASSCALYGTPEYLPVDENHPVKPLSPYGISKHTVEHYLYQNHILYGLSFIALRYANVYGPRQNPRGEGGVVAIFAGKMLEGEQPTIYGLGDKSRDYVYVDDVVRANIMAAESDETGIFNIGTSEEILDQMVFELISRECNYDGSPFYGAERSGEMKRMCIDNSRAVKILKWNPNVHVREGITRAIAYYKNELIKTPTTLRPPREVSTLMAGHSPGNNHRTISPRA
jgi:UDP-glucose 4-epimerase